MFSVQTAPYKVKKLVSVARGTLEGVTTSGAVFPAALGKSVVVQQLFVKRTAGSGDYSVMLFSDSALQDEIAHFQVPATPGKLQVNKLGLYAQNSDSPTTSNIYLQITPVEAGPSDFSVSLFADKN